MLQALDLRVSDLFTGPRPTARERSVIVAIYDYHARDGSLVARKERSASVVFLVEGEKAVDRLRELGLTATCGAAGASTWKPERSADLLEAAPTATIVILPDNDRPGEQYSERVAADIASVHARRGGGALDLKVAFLAPLPPGSDVVDWLAASHHRGTTATLGSP